MFFGTCVHVFLLFTYLVMGFLGPIMHMIDFQITGLTYPQLLKTTHEGVWEEEGGLWVIFTFS